MAELDTQVLQQAASTTADTVIIAAIIIVILGTIGFLIWFIWWKNSHKHSILLRVKTKGATDMVIFDKYKYVQKNGEAEKIRLWKLKKYKPIPPEAAKDFTTKGAEYVEGWLADTGEVRYIESEVEDILYLEQENKTKSSIKFEAIDTDDKEFYANALFDAQRLKKKSILEWISENAPIIAIVFLFLVVVVFWQDITAPMIKVSETNAEISKQNYLIMQSLETIIQDRQIVKPETSPPD